MIRTHNSYYGLFEYDYNYNGTRTSRTTNRNYYHISKHEYQLVENKITREYISNDDTFCEELYLYYMYDENGKIFSVIVDNLTTGDQEQYYNATNMLGDVIAILDEGGNVVQEFAFIE